MSIPVVSLDPALRRILLEVHLQLSHRFLVQTVSEQRKGHGLLDDADENYRQTAIRRFKVQVDGQAENSCIDQVSQQLGTVPEKIVDR